MTLWAVSVGWVFVVVRAPTAEEAQRLAIAKADEVGCDEVAGRPRELVADGDAGIVVEFIG